MNWILKKKMLNEPLITSNWDKITKIYTCSHKKTVLPLAPFPLFSCSLSKNHCPCFYSLASVSLACLTSLTLYLPRLLPISHSSPQSRPSLTPLMWTLCPRRKIQRKMTCCVGGGEEDEHDEWWRRSRRIAHSEGEMVLEKKRKN